MKYEKVNGKSQKKFSFALFFIQNVDSQVYRTQPKSKIYLEIWVNKERLCSLFLTVKILTEGNVVNLRIAQVSNRLKDWA